MNKVGFEKSVRMFRKFSEETLRRRGSNQLGHDGVAALLSIEAVLRGERLFDGSLLEPLAAFTNLLQSSQLPPEFGDFSFGDALLAVEQAHADQRAAAEQVWEFAPELGADVADKLSALSAAEASAPASAPGEVDAEHAGKLAHFVLSAAQAAKPDHAVVSGVLASETLPLAELAARFQRVTLNDLDLERLEQRVRRDVPEALRARLELERYDATGSYDAFARGVDQRVAAAGSQEEAEQALLGFLQSYDVGAGSAGLTAREGRADLAVSVLTLSGLGRGYAPYVAQAFTARGWAGPASVAREPIASALALLTRWVEQHHIHALLRRSVSAVLISAVSEIELQQMPGGEPRALGEPRDLLGVEHLAERLPQIAQAKEEQSWEWRRRQPAEKRSLLTLVEAVLV